MTLALKNPDILLFKYLWILVLCPKELQFVLLFGYTLLINTDRQYKFKYYPDTLFVLMLSYSAIHIISIIINVLLYDQEPVRIAAAINTAFIWGIAAFAYSYFKNHKVEIEKIYRFSFINLLILIGLACISFIIFHILNMNKPNILGINLYGIDWFRNKPRMRFKGGMEYNNLVVILYVMLLPFAAAFFNNKSKLNKNIFILASLIPVYLCLSRSGYVIIGSAFFLVFIFCKDYKKKDYIMIGVIITAIAILILLYGEKIEELIFTLINSRAGSNNTRMQIYRESIVLTLMKSPIWGMGIKKISESGYPLGSHSTYIGVFYKTGIIGTLIFTGVLISIIRILIKVHNKTTFQAEAIFLLMLLLEFAVEDIDGADWVIVLLFAIIGIIANRYKLTLNFNYTPIKPDKG